MAVPPLPKLKAIKLTKLQALLLLGGAFVLAAGIWTAFTQKVVHEPDWGPYGDTSAVLTVYGNDPSARHFIDRLIASSSDTVEIPSLSARSATTFYAEADQAGGGLKIHYSGASEGPGPSHSRLRLVPRDTQATGFIVISGRKEPVTAVFDDGKAVFQVGRTYRGAIGDAYVQDAGRRMIASLNQETFYLEKPAGASWGNVSSLLGLELQRFPALSAFWALPGRVELSVGSAHADGFIQPFSLYYRPSGSIIMPRAKLEAYAKDLLADALPRPIEVKLPDGSRMQELRHDTEAIQAGLRQNQFGDIVKYSYSDRKEALYAFYAKSGEAWLTTDLDLVQGILLGNINKTAPADACHKGGSGGFAVVPGSFLPLNVGFKNATVSIHNLETGMFTICGYY